MNDKRWLNTTQPQTLVSATILLYFEAVFAILQTNTLLLLLLAIAAGVGGFGIANEKRWGYGLAIAATGLKLFFYLQFLFRDVALLFSLRFWFIIVWPILLFVLLLHPHSRSYQKIWFR